MFELIKKQMDTIHHSKKGIHMFLNQEKWNRDEVG